jgi:hypothetical protein
MQFINTETVFPSYVHKIIYTTAIRQTPIEISLADTDRLSPEILISCREYFAFILNMFSEMYENPLKWGMNAGEYEAFLDGKKENAVKRKFPDKVNELRSKTNNSVPAYMELLRLSAECGIANETGLFIPNSKYKDIKKRFDKQTAPKIKNIYNDISYKTRMDALAGAGLIITEKDDGAVITSEKYPGMFLAMSELAKRVINVKTFGEHNFYNTDFRQLRSDYNPVYEDIVRILSPEKRKISDKIHALAKEIKLRGSCTTYWKINYSYKGMKVMCIDTCEWPNFRVGINGSNYGNNGYLDLIAGQGDEFVRYFMRHMNYCKACSTSHIGGFKEVLGRKVRLCGHPSFGIANPKEEDLYYIEKFIEFRKEMISVEK